MRRATSPFNARPRPSEHCGRVIRELGFPNVLLGPRTVGTIGSRSPTGLPRPGPATASCHRTRRRPRCCPYSAGRHPSGGSSARRAGGLVSGQFLSRGRTTSHTISPTRTTNSTPIPSHPSEPIPFPKPPIMLNSSFVCQVPPGHLQCLAWVLRSWRETIPCCDRRHGSSGPDGVPLVVRLGRLEETLPPAVIAWSTPPTGHHPRT
jgi:hypothetical protein